MIKATTQPVNGDFGSTDTRESRQAMMEDAMSRGRVGTYPVFDMDPQRSPLPTYDWTTQPPPYKSSFQKPTP